MQFSLQYPRDITVLSKTYPRPNFPQLYLIMTELTDISIIFFGSKYSFWAPLPYELVECFIRVLCMSMKTFF